MPTADKTICGKTACSIRVTEAWWQLWKCWCRANMFPVMVLSTLLIRIDSIVVIFCFIAVCSVIQNPVRILNGTSLLLDHYSLYLLTETLYITIFICADPVKNTNTEIIVGIFLDIVVDDLMLFLWAKIMIIILFHPCS